MLKNRLNTRVQEVKVQELDGMVHLLDVIYRETAMLLTVKMCQINLIHVGMLEVYPKDKRRVGQLKEVILHHVLNQVEDLEMSVVQNLQK